MPLSVTMANSNAPFLANKFLRAVYFGITGEVKQGLCSGQLDLTEKIHGKSLLRIAGEKGHREITMLLVEHGMDANESGGRRKHSLLHHAALTYNFGFASVLLNKQAIPSPRSSNNSTPLHIAARTGQEYLARKLIEFEAEIDAQDTLGRTPLHLAFAKGHAQLARKMIDANANIQIEDKHGVTPSRVAEMMDIVI